MFAATDIADQRLILSKLVAEGLCLDLSEIDKTTIINGLRKGSTDRVQLCLRPGFTEKDKNYLTASGEILGDCNEFGPLPYPEAQTFFCDERAKGELAEWQDNVVPLAQGNSRLILALSYGFAGPCIHLTGIESGGFHFYGESSTGKSTLMLMPASIFGDSRFVKKWHMTDAAFEQACEARNDGILLLDELKLLAPKQSDAAAMAQSRIYILGSDEGKQRHTSYQKTVSRWRLVMLSTGEFSLGQHATEGNLTRLDGERVRVVDVPADAGVDCGVFDTVPNKLTPRRLAERIQSRCDRYYGTAGPDFITKMLKEGRSTVKKKIKGHIEYFIKHHEIDEDDGLSIRMAKRFALAYAGGVLASEYGVLPLTEGDIMSGVSRCYHDACGNPVKRFDLSDKFKDMLKSKVLDLRKPSPKSYSKEDFDKRSILLKDIEKEPMYMVKTTFFEKNITGNVKLKDVLVSLRDAGILHPSKDRKNTRVVTHNRIRLARRYCLFKDELDKWLDRG